MVDLGSYGSANIAVINHILLCRPGSLGSFLVAIPLPGLLLRELIRSLVLAQGEREGLAYVIYIETHMASVLYDFPALTVPTSSSLLVILREKKRRERKILRNYWRLSYSPVIFLLCLH